VALLLDATVIRSIVLPSLLGVLGERTWYLPRWLSWLPRVDVEHRRPPTLAGTSAPRGGLGANALAPE